MEKDNREYDEDEDESVLFEPPDDLIVQDQASFNDSSEITFDRSHHLDQDASSGSEEESGINSSDAYADYRRQTERIRTREQYSSPQRNRVTLKAPAKMFSRPMAVVHQKMNQTMNHFRKDKGHNTLDSSADDHRSTEQDRVAPMRLIRRNHYSESTHQVISKTPGGSIDLNDFQLLASGGIPDNDREIRRGVRRSKSTDGGPFEHAGEARDTRRGVRRSKSMDGGPFEYIPKAARDTRRGVRRTNSTDGSANEPRREELRERRRNTTDDGKLDFQALASGRDRAGVRRHKSSDQL